MDADIALMKELMYRLMVQFVNAFYRNGPLFIRTEGHEKAPSNEEGA